LHVEGKWSQLLESERPRHLHLAPDLAHLVNPAVVPEATLDQTEAGLVPASTGWFVLNARDARCCADVETQDTDVSYADVPPSQKSRYRDGALPD
jgi:hypothetical protein